MSQRAFVVVTSPEVTEIIGERVVLNPPRVRRTWTNSRLVGLDDGTTIPLIHLIAERKFGPWDPATHFPVWKDKDWCNESLENVDLVSKFQSDPVPKKNPFGVPAGTPEYMKRWRAANKEKVKASLKRSYEKRKGLRERLDEAEAKLAKYENPNAPKTAELANALTNIIGAPIDPK
jgi:hypothetical protein